jgi:2-oxoglutarate dehydrogenase E2 component (dihydrolipoamide succinyltransferase)
LHGGNFTISNNGAFNGMLGTPMLTAPQSAILGIHNIENRGIVVGDEVEARPMMYLALTYDHRLLDGREAVLFLRKIKLLVEDPIRILLKL